jgi:hypothetical protein
MSSRVAMNVAFNTLAPMRDLHVLSDISCQQKV